jgi:UDP-N-acetylglucosamine--N-acetylmuramyl-(pentapeptide) pyrophosphoryl-undecaprenol N-acetylglucosamine transferase
MKGERLMKIALTGGGTAGHVNPNIALIPELVKRGFKIFYIGSRNGIEKRLIEPLGIDYYSISSGKLRRYASLKNITDMGRFVKGIPEAAKILKELKIDIVFSKGGFVGLPVSIGAKLNKIPLIIHESDYTPGLANRIAIPSAKKVCVNFPETKELLKDKAVLTGNPIRPELFKGDKKRGLSFCGLSDKKPKILIMGGSLGSHKINDCVRSILRGLLQKYDIIHLCGKGNADYTLTHDGYCQFEYVTSQLPDLFAISDMVVSRAGANALTEIAALKKPNLLIPLSGKVSRGDQVLNAVSYEKRGFSLVLPEEELTAYTLAGSIEKLYNKRQKYTDSLNANNAADAVTEVVKVIVETAGGMAV